MRIERLTVPTPLPFQQADLAEHLRVSDPSDAYAVQKHGKAAAAELERYASIALIDQTIRVTLDAWPRGYWLELPIAPLVDVLSVAVTVDGAAFDLFSIVAGNRPGLRLSGDKPCGVIVIEYLAGFGPSVADIPADLSLAIMDQAAATFDQRGILDPKSGGPGMSPHAARIAARYRRVAL